MPVRRIGRIRVFVDGVAKKCSEGPTAQIDKEFQALLNEAGIPFRWTDLSADLAIPPGELHASHECLERIRSVVREGEEDAAIVLGSGSITDLVKHALHLEGRPIPFVSIPTALTVTAFTSAFAIIDFHGAKRTLQSRPVSAAFWVRPFLECAPAGMSRAGYGDLLARFVAYGDWFLGHRLGVMERYDESAFRLMEPFAGGIRDGSRRVCRLSPAAGSHGVYRRGTRHGGDFHVHGRGDDPAFRLRACHQPRP